MEDSYRKSNLEIAVDTALKNAPLVDGKTIRQICEEVDIPKKSSPFDWYLKLLESSHY